MRKTFLRITSELQRRRQGTERGFSLIELIVVVAILGVLVAIAIPVFGNIQATARQNAVAAVAANGATQATAQIANGDPATLIESGDTAVTVTWKGGGTTAPTTIDTVCVVAKHTSGETAESGPGC